MERGEVDRALAALQDSAALIGVAGADGVATLDARFARILSGVARHVPGVDYAGVTLGPGTSTVCHPPHESQVVRDLEDVQWRLGEGPCVMPLRANRNGSLVVGDLVAEPARWPRYSAVAARWGVRSLMAFLLCPLEVPPGPGTPPSGVVTVYSRTPDAFAELSRTIGALFAMQVTLVLHGARQFGRLIEAMGSGEVVGRATGILMERFGLDGTQAHQMLVSSAEDTNIPLVEMATWLAAQGKGPRSVLDPGPARTQN